jgi:hypothetical protein
MPIAAASEYNPQCSKCLARLPEVTRTAAAVMPSLTERVAIPDGRYLGIRRKAAPPLVVVARTKAPLRLAKDMTRAA